MEFIDFYTFFCFLCKVWPHTATELCPTKNNTIFSYYFAEMVVVKFLYYINIQTQTKRSWRKPQMYTLFVKEFFSWLYSQVKKRRRNKGKIMTLIVATTFAFHPADFRLTHLFLFGTPCFTYITKILTLSIVFQRRKTKYKFSKNNTFMKTLLWKQWCWFCLEFSSDSSFHIPTIILWYIIFGVY